MTIKQIPEILDEINRLHTISLDDSISEGESDSAYMAMWDYINDLACFIVTLTDHLIDEFTAKRMIVHHPDRIRAAAQKAITANA